MTSHGLRILRESVQDPADEVQPCDVADGPRGAGHHLPGGERVTLRHLYPHIWQWTDSGPRIRSSALPSNTRLAVKLLCPLPSRGRVRERGPARQGNGLEDRLRLGQHRVVPEADDTVSATFKPARSLAIVLHLDGMLSAVEEDKVGVARARSYCIDPPSPAYSDAASWVGSSKEHESVDGDGSWGSMSKRSSSYCQVWIWG